LIGIVALTKRVKKKKKKNQSERKKAPGTDGPHLTKSQNNLYA
jgi:hypothetical protein